MYRLPRLPLLLGAFALGAALIAGCAASDPNVEGARLELRNQNYDRVVELTDAAIAANPENADAYYLRGEAYRNLLEQATTSEQREQYATQMVAAYDQARTLDPGNQVIQVGLMQAYAQEMNRGIEAFRAGAEDQQAYLDAADAFGNAARIMPDSTDAYLNQGLALLGGGQTAPAAAPLQQAIERGSDAPEAYLYLGRIYLSEDRADEALRVLETARERFPEDEDIQSELLNAYGRTGQVDQALSAYQQEVAQRPDDPVRRYNYGSFLLQAQRYEEAAEQLQRATELDPDNVNAYYNLGAAYINQVVALNEEASDLPTNSPRLAQIEQERRELLATAIPPLERARQLLEAEGQDAQPVCESLFRAYAQLGRSQDAQAAAQCAGIDLN